ncbi:MAG: hypothetical protein MUP92_01270 [Actinobacteria bacterium]|nr:hypothetical protein [Actinomycetota bacterium]
MGVFKRFLERITESDEERLLAEIQEWVDVVPNVVPLGGAPMRQRVRVAGQVRRITVWPREGGEPEYLEALIIDGSRVPSDDGSLGPVAELGVTWIGRRSIPGLRLGTRLVVEGTIRTEKTGGNSMDNPKWEFAG